MRSDAASSYVRIVGPFRMAQVEGVEGLGFCSGSFALALYKGYVRALPRNAMHPATNGSLTPSRALGAAAQFLSAGAALLCARRRAMQCIGSAGQKPNGSLCRTAARQRAHDDAR